MRALINITIDVAGGQTVMVEDEVKLGNYDQVIERLKKLSFRAEKLLLDEIDDDDEIGEIDELIARHGEIIPDIDSANEDDIKILGFQLLESYEHDIYTTNRYQLGHLIVEFTYEGKKLLTCDLSINNFDNMPISMCQIKQIAKLLGHWV